MSMKSNAERGKVHASLNRRKRFWRQVGGGEFEDLFAKIESAETPEQAAYWNAIHHKIMDEHPTLSPNSKVDIFRYFDKMQQMDARRGGMPHGESSSI